MPGRKTDAADAAWIAELVEYGLVRPSFVPPQPIRELRNLTRYRKAQVEERTREVQRLDKILQDAGLKLSSVASDLPGKSGRAMLDALASGATDPGVLSELARGQLRKKIPALREALTALFTGHHAIIVSEILSQLDYLDEAIGRLSVEIDRVIAPFADEVALLYESAGKSKGGKIRKGSKWLRLYLHEAARAAFRTKNTYLSAQYGRIKARRGPAKARVAVEHSILVAA